MCGKLTQNSHGWHPLWDLQVIVATNDSGPLCRKEVNRVLQAQLNPTGCGVPGHCFKVGDKVICLRNHLALDANNPSGNPRYLANDEIGEVIDAARPGKLLLRFSVPDRFILAPVGKGKQEEDEGHSGIATNDFDLAYPGLRTVFQKDGVNCCRAALDGRDDLPAAPFHTRT